MAQTYHSDSATIDINKVADGTLEDWTDDITITKVLVGVVMEVRITHPEMVAQIGESKYTIPANTVSVNTVDVPVFTTYHCYYELVDNNLVFVSSITNPDLVSPEPEYVWIRMIRFKSVAGTATIEFVQRQIMSHDEALHCLADYGYLIPPVYISGFAPTFNLVTGTLSTEAGMYRRLTGEIRETTATTNGLLYEPAVDLSRANFSLISKYSDNTAVTANKYFKALVGILVNKSSDYDYIVNIQGKPAIEYASATAAWADAEHVASTGFSSTRRSAVLPLCWIVMKVGDASTIEYMDLRETGLAYASGGTSGVTDHGALVGLSDDDHANYLTITRHDTTTRHGASVVDHGTIAGLTHDDHTQYLLSDGSRALSGNLSVNALVTIDGVDVSAHAANAAAHHDAVTLAASADAVLGLSTQQITLDTQSANTILAGPTSGVAASPTFRTISSSDVSDFTEAAQDAIGAMVASSNSITLTYTDGTPSLVASNVMKEVALPLVNGENANITGTGGDLFIISGPTATFGISGLTGGSTGRRITIINNTTANFTIYDEGTNSTAANRILTGTGSNILSNKASNVTLVYSSTLSRWVVTGWIS